MISTLLNHQGSLINIDINGELFNKTAAHRAEFSDIHLYAPMEGIKDSNKQVFINPLLEVPRGQKSIKYCEIITEALLGHKEFDEADLHEVASWKYAQQMITGLLIYILHYEEAQQIHLPRLFDYYSIVADQDNPNTLGSLFSGKFIDPKGTTHNRLAPKTSREKGLIAEVHDYLKQLQQNFDHLDDYTLAGALRVMCRALWALLTNKKTNENLKNSTFLLSDVIRPQRPQSLYIQVNKNSLAILAPLLRVFYTLTAQLMIDDKAAQETTPSQNILFLYYAPERYMMLNSLEHNLPKLKAVGGRFMFITEAMAPLEKHYAPQKDLLNNFEIKVFMDTEEDSLLVKQVREQFDEAVFRGDKKGFLTTSDGASRIITRLDYQQYPELLALTNKVYN